MASSVGNSGFSVNQQFANQLGRGEGKTTENLRNQSGVTHTAKKTTVAKGGRVAEEGSQLSPAAREALKSEQAQHADHMAEHGNEMAQQAGLDVPADGHEQSELQRKRGHDRDQELLADGEVSKDGKHVAMNSPEGTKQVMKVEDHAYLTKKMDDPDFTDEQVLGDIPPAKLEAANAVMDTQLAQGASKVAVLKTDPKIDAVAETMEMQPTPPLAEPMDIRDSSNDPKMKPLQLELPLEMHQVAAEKAAAELASGNHQEEAMIAGGIPGGGPQSVNTATPKPAAEPMSAELQDAHVETSQNERILSKLEKGPLDMSGKSVSQRDGYEAVRNNAQDRFQSAFEDLPGEAQQAVHNNLTSIKNEFHEDPTNTNRYKQASPEERTAIETGWMAQASQQFAANPGLSLEAVGAPKDLKLDPANMKHLADGANHYLKASDGLDKHTEVKAPKAAAAAEDVKPAQEGATKVRTDGPFPTAEMPEKASTESLKQFSEPLAEAQLKMARSQLNPGQKADLEMLEADVASIRSIGAKMNANPNDKELWAKSQAEVAGIQARIGQTAGRYQQPGALQVTFGPPPNGEVYTHLSWHQAQVGTEVRQQGYQGMSYTLMSAAGKTDYQLTARPTDGNGQNDGTYVQYRVASDDPKSWQGVAAVVGNLQGVNGYSACTTAVGDNTLQTQMQTNPQTLTPGQAAVIKQAMGDLKVTWPAGGSPAPNAAQGPGQPQQPVSPGYVEYQRYMNQNPQMAGYYPPAWQPQQPPFMPNMGGYPNYQPYPPNNYGGMPGGGWNSWGGAGMGGMNGMYGMNNLYGMGGMGMGMGMGGFGMGGMGMGGFGMGGLGGGGGMNAMMGMFAVSSLISSISFPLMMFSMF